MKQRLIVAITGASGTIYGVRILEALRAANIESHLVMSDSAKLTMAAETDYKPGEVEEMADVVHSAKNVGATISSGSFNSMGMVIAPCSIRTLSEIASGVTSSLVSRAADVVLKERRKLVLLVRETPLHAGHLRSMSQVTEYGAIVMPPVPAFYARPQTLDEMVNHTVGRALDLFGIGNSLVTRWGGMGSSK